ncbi:MAG: APC family permease [Microbacteriaceae bacterium]
MSAPKQQIGLVSAVAIGVASMLGAGVFNVFADAAAKNYELLMVSLLLAATVATLNAASVYQLAKRTSRPGGIYAYARAEWNSTASFVAGFAFVFGKIGSIAAIAYVFGVYLAPTNALLCAVAAIVLLTLLNLMGINRTALVAAVLASATTLYLLISSLAGLANSTHGLPIPYFAEPVGGVLPAASLLFFAFAGYARVATLGDEVRNPLKNIPRAIAITLVLVLAVYLLVAASLTSYFGAELTHISRPFAVIGALVLPDWVTVLVISGASLGSMLALLAGVSRTAASMAEDSELPKAFAHRNRFGAPWLAEVIIALGSIALLLLNPYWQWIVGFSSFSVLLYYAIGHVSAFRIQGRQSLGRRSVQVLGFTLCAVLLLAVPGPAVWVSGLILVLAVAIRWLVRARAGR